MSAFAAKESVVTKLTSYSEGFPGAARKAFTVNESRPAATIGLPRGGRLGWAQPVDNSSVPKNSVKAANLLNLKFVSIS